MRKRGDSVRLDANVEKLPPRLCDWWAVAEAVRVPPLLFAIDDPAPSLWEFQTAAQRLHVQERAD